jgi:hypothetical protein
MEAGVGDSKQRGDILFIPGKILQPMRESKCGGSDSPILGNTPVSSVSDDFGRFNRSERELKVSKSFDLEVIIRCGKLSTEDGIEVNCFSNDNLFSFRIGELWTGGRVRE